MNDIRKLKVEIQSKGVRIEDLDKGRRGGAGPAAGKSFIINEVIIESISLREYLTFMS